MNHIFINGTDYTDDVIEGLDDIEIELGLNTDTKTIGKTLSTDIKVDSKAFEFLNSFFFKNCDSWEKSVKSVFKSSICGGLLIDCEITSEGVNKSIFKDELTFNLKSSDEVSRAYARLDSELITSNGFAETNDIPIHYYVDQPNYLMWVLFILTLPIRVVFNTIDATLTTICNVATLGLNKDNCKTNITGAIFSTFDTWITGTGRWAPAPLVREMINYQCSQVGLKFVSSILNDPGSSRYNLALFCLTGGENGDYKNTSKVERVRVLKENEPLFTTIDFLKHLSTVFAADYRIIEDTLYFEPVEYFDNLRTNKIFNIKDICIDDDVELSYNTGDACAYGEYEYTDDSFDTEGNSAKRTHYRGRLEFNDPYNPSQKGKCTRQLNFGPAKFMFDKKSYQRNGFFNFQRWMDDFRDGPDTFLAETFFDNEGVERHFDLVLSNSQLALHKLLVLENGFNRSDAKTIKEKLAIKHKKQYWVYNKPMHIDQLSKDFYYIDNPRLRKDKYKLSDFEIDCDCEYVKKALKDFQTIYIETEFGKAIPENVTVTFGDTIKIKFSNIKVVC